MNSKHKIKYAYGYVRVSTTKQADEGTSIDNQRIKIEKWANLNDIKLITVEVDSGISGTLPADQRPNIVKILSQMGKGDVLVTTSYSRFSRNMADGHNILKILGDKGAYFISLDEGFDTTTSAGKMMLKIMTVVSEIEVEQIADRSALASESMKHRGLAYHRPPYGWVKASNESGMGFIEDSDQQEVIKLIKQKRKELLNGAPKTYAQIARELKKKKILSPSGKKDWTPETIKAILKRGNVNVLGRKQIKSDSSN